MRRMSWKYFSVLLIGEQAASFHAVYLLAVNAVSPRCTRELCDSMTPGALHGIKAISLNKHISYRPAFFSACRASSRKRHGLLVEAKPVCVAGALRIHNP